LALKVPIVKISSEILLSKFSAIFSFSSERNHAKSPAKFTFRSNASLLINYFIIKRIKNMSENIEREPTDLSILEKIKYIDVSVIGEKPRRETGGPSATSKLYKFDELNVSDLTQENLDAVYNLCGMGAEDSKAINFCLAEFEKGTPISTIVAVVNALARENYEVAVRDGDEYVVCQFRSDCYDINGHGSYVHEIGHVIPASNVSPFVREESKK
jgi:hypothetical protein